MQFRLHIDIEMGYDESNAIARSEQIMESIRNAMIESEIKAEISYRLGHDEDRQKSNYMNKNENGHVTTKKLEISIQ